MLIARAPVRISIAGGGTDLAAYYERFGGLVVSAAIAKYFYAVVEVTGRPGLQISSSDYHAFFRNPPGHQLAWEGDLSLPRAIVHHFGLTDGIEMFLASEVPPGTGLGSSSSVAVTIIKALATLLHQPATKQMVAETACYIEIEKLGKPIGKQDQYAAAFGGINAITFTRDQTIVEPLAISDATQRTLEQSLLLFFTGASHNSATILREQTKSTQQQNGAVVDALHDIKRLAEMTCDALETDHPERIGELLHENWERKKRLASGISNRAIDEAYDTARAHGALGGKITGAGGGGFLMLYCPPACHEAVTDALKEHGLIRMDFHVDSAGARVLVNSGAWLDSSSFTPPSVPAAETENLATA
jgi:D-glycero-alpha-D-manno-heptose-7-phosphate kinase